jgi:small-conductance mechanosensitive channel
VLHAAEGNAKEEKNTADTLRKIEVQILKDGNVAQQAAQVKQMANEIKALDAEQDELAREANRLSADPDSDADQAALAKSKLALSELKIDLAERKERFLKEKIELQKIAHKKIQIYLRDIFVDGANVADIISSIKQLRWAERQRMKEKLQLRHEIGKVTARIQVEEKYLSAKNVMLVFAKRELIQLWQEAIAVAAERLSLLKALKSLLEEQLQFTENRLLTLDEFDKMIRLRRIEVIQQKISLKEPYSYELSECLLAAAVLFLLAAIWMIRRWLVASLRGSLTFARNGFALVFGKMVYFLLLGSFMSYLVLNVLGYRFTAMFVGLVGLNCVVGLVLIAIVKWTVELLFLKLLAKQIAQTIRTEGKQSSVIIFLINTLFTWWVAWAVFSEILKVWAVKKEVVEFMARVVNFPLFQTGNVTISLWTLGRSGLAFWIFYFFGYLVISLLKNHVLPKTALDRNSQHAIKSVVRLLFIVTGVLVGVQLLGVDMGVLAVFSGTLGIGIGFGLQDIVKNVFSGIMILFERPIKIGDVVEVSSTLGFVKSIRTRSTIVNTFDNVSIVVPNSEFLGQRVVNWSHSDPVVRLEINVGVDYDSDVSVVKQTLLDIARENSKVVPQPEPFVIFSEFGDSALLFKLYLWTDVKDRMTVKSDINFSIYAKFREKGIQIPFPQHDLHLKSMDFEFKSTK